MLTQTELAHLVAVDQATIVYWEKRTTVPQDRKSSIRPLWNVLRLEREHGDKMATEAKD